MKIFVLPGLPDYALAHLTAHIPSTFTVTEHLSDADVVLGSTTAIAKLSRSVQDLHAIQNKVKLIQSISAGYDAVNLPALFEHQLPFATNDGANAVAVAEHTLLLILALYKQLIPHHNALRHGNYVAQPVTTRFELAGKTVGIIGLGRIGREVADRLQAFDVHLIYSDLYRQEAAEKRLGIQYYPLNNLLMEADVLTIHVPLTDQTQNLISDPEFKLMKPTAIIINTARGSIVDEDALYRALTIQRIAGAGIDAWVDEGFLKEGKQRSPLWDLDNVVMTPHIAGPTYDTVFRRIDNAIANFIRVAQGELAHSVIKRMKCAQCGYLWDALSHRAHEAVCPHCNLTGTELYPST